MSTADLLLEIGSEEIPAGYIAPAADELRSRLEGFLRARGLDYDGANVAVFSTPRRLAVRIPAVATQQPTRTETRLGPAVSAAFGPDGAPTKAAAGFARSCGVEARALVRAETDRGERVAAKVTTGGAPTRELLLRELDLVELVQLGFPKTMRWIPGCDLRYARPVRWLVCLFGDEVVPLRLEQLEADRISRGHRTLDPRAVEIPRPADYESALAEAKVVVDPQVRRQSILEAARAEAERAGGRLHEDAELLDEVTQLVEHPTVVVGAIDPERVRQLPPEVIVTAMRAHQRYFSVEREDGSLCPVFLTFRDGDRRGLDNVVEGNERVLRARLDDALFYWNEDRSLSSDQKLERLGRVVWLEGFGSIEAKCRRIADLAVALADGLSLDADHDVLRRAALLCKSDLATEMIRDGKEFTKLQGIIGRYYALEAGEASEVADAIAEHLRPRSAGDDLPTGLMGTLVAMADRLDSIGGCVLAGFAPTGGQDPYALRRQALAILRILESRGWNVDLEAWVQRSVDGHAPADADRSAAVDTVLDLFWGRLETVLSDLPVEIVRGVLSVARLDPVENVRAARALAVMSGTESFARLLEGAKRCRNILLKEERLPEEGLEGQARAHALRDAAARSWDAWRRHADGADAEGYAVDGFTDEAERSLHAAALKRVPSLEEARSAGDHDRVFGILSELGPVISRYFDEVLVNAPEARVRDNRLGFLQQIHYLFARFGDLSRVVVN